VGLSGICFLGVVVYACLSFCSSSSQSPGTKQFNDLTKEGLKITLDSSRDLFQVGLLLAGGMWALYIGKVDDTKVDLTETPMLGMFVMLNVAFICSFIMYYFSTQQIASIIYEGVVDQHSKDLLIPDALSLRIRVLSDSQRVFFFLGCVLALGTFLTGRYLKD
jgi:hypothetical protein